jgi:hypothetical protein
MELGTPRRLLPFLAAGTLLAAFLTGYALWWNAPAQVASRYLDKLARTATVYSETGPLQRRLRASRLSEMLANPLAIHLPEAHLSSSFDPEELLSGYLSIALEASYLQVTFSKLKLRERSSRFLKVEARLSVVADYPDERFPLDQRVDLKLEKEGDRLLLSSVSARANGS